MPIDKNNQYVFRIGSDIQHRLYWKGNSWHYEMLAGSVVFDQESAASEEKLGDVLAGHGLTFEQFALDKDKSAEAYSNEIQTKVTKLQELGIQPCPKHGLTSKNPDNTCEACENTDYPDDMKGTEG